MARVNTRNQALVAQLLCLLMIFWVASSFPTRWDSESFAVQTSPLFYMMQAAIEYISIPICLYLLLQHSQTILARLRAAWPWVLLTAWALVSTLWSIELKPTLFAAATICSLLIIMAYAANWIDVAVLSRMLAIYAILLCGISMLMGLAMPQYGLMNIAKFSGLLRGVYSHKNLLGDTVSLFLIWLVCARFARVLTGPLSWIAIGLCSITILWSWSTTSVLMVLCCLLLIFALQTALSLRMSVPTLTAAILLFLLLALIAIPIASELILPYFGKDLTFSGRDVIWAAYWDLGNQRPIAGFGYRALMNSQDYGIAIRFPNGGRPSPHNSLLQIYLDMGVVGFTLYTVGSILIIAQGVRRIGMGDRVGFFSVVFPVGYAINGMMEGVDGFYLSLGLLLLFYLAARPSTVPLRLTARATAPARGERLFELNDSST